MPVANNRRWYLPMVARDTDEAHRASTPLELLFDLCFVVAVSQASGRLHHGLSHGEIGHSVGSYLMVFFAIWWAWVNFTWFASAYDTDDGLYRITTLVLITGALILAAGIPRAFDQNDFTVVVIGYVVMRFAMVAHWLRAAYSDPERRRTDMRFAIGIAIVQCGWIARLALPDRFGKASFVVLAVCELLVPIWAEHAERTTWHPGHIAERYGLFTLIVLGESVLSATDAIQTAFDAGGARVGLLMLSAAGLCVVFAMWWLYFDRPGHELLSTASSGFVFGYGHFLIFASVAAVGAGLAVNVDVDQHVAHISARTGAFTVAVPVAIYLMSIWKLHHRLDQGASRTWGIPIAALVILLSPFLPSPITVIAVVLAALVVAVTLRRTSRRSDFGSPIGRRG